MTTVNDLMDLTAEELAAVSDEIIKSVAYGIKNFEFGYGFKATDARRKNLWAMDSRLKELEAAEEKVTETVSAPDFTNGKTLDCGCIVYYKSEIMNASNGTACINCYDRMSD